MLQLVVAAKLASAQAKEQLDALKRENARLQQLVSETKGKLANAKAAHEDMEAACAHAITDRQAALTELEAHKKPQRAASFFSRS
mmetsp:Transcript_41376/g.93217  ORF Transcript_41376/g.93217 Transcript_41376/m.93217 type:complete len:85 (+) Transcript_41376:955-1209(+)